MSEEGLHFRITKRFKILEDLRNFNSVQNRDGLIVEYFFNTGKQVSETYRVCFLKSSGTSRVSTGAAFPGLWFPFPGIIKDPQDRTQTWYIKGEPNWKSDYVFCGSNYGIPTTWHPMPDTYFSKVPSKDFVFRMCGSSNTRKNNLLEYFGGTEHMLISAMLDRTHFAAENVLKDLDLTKVFQGPPTRDGVVFIPDRRSYDVAARERTPEEVWQWTVMADVNNFLETERCCRIIPSDGYWETTCLWGKSCCASMVRKSYPEPQPKDKRVGGLRYNKSSKKNRSTIKHKKNKLSISHRKKCKYSKKKRQ